MHLGLRGFRLRVSIYRLSTFERAQGVFLKKLRLDLIEGSLLKHRIEMRFPSPSH